MSVEITLTRDMRTEGETIGWLRYNVKKWATIERTWVPSVLTPAGEKGVSCLPCGEFRIEAHDSEAHPKSFALVNHALDVYHWPHEVPAAKRSYARTVCLIHPANWAHELRGCVAPGKERKYDQSKGRWEVRHSRDAMNEIRSLLMSSTDARLIIVDGRT
jgi:hypothetical protein